MRVVKSVFEIGKWYESKINIKQKLIAVVPGRSDCLLFWSPTLGDRADREYVKKVASDCLLFWSPTLGVRFHYPDGKRDFYAESSSDITPVPVPPPSFLEEVVLERPE